jgi:hypothetical protein
VNPTIHDLRLFVQSTSAHDFLRTFQREKPNSFQFPKALRIFLLVFAALWLGGTGVSTYSNVQDLVRECRFVLWALPVEATVRQTQKAARGNVAVTLAYRMGGRDYSTVQFLPASDPRLAAQGAAELEVAKLTLYCDASDPAHPRLTREPQGTPAVGVLFMMPFVAIGIGMLLLAVSNSLGFWVVRGIAFLVIYTPLSAVSAFVLGIAGMFLPERWSLIIGVGMVLGYPLIAALGLRLIVGIFYRKLKFSAVQRLAEMERAGADKPDVEPAVEVSVTPAAEPAETPSGVIDVEADQLSPNSLWSAEAEMKGLAGMGGLVFFTLFWCGITSVFVGFVVSSFYMGWRVQSRYVTTEGNVLSSAVESHSDSDGDNIFGAKIAYAYTVNGRLYDGNRYAYGDISTNDSGYFQQLVARHPVGSKVTVYYDPAKPDQSVLSPKVESSVYFMILFLQPFVMIGLAMLAYTVSFPLRRRRVHRFLAGPAQPPCRIPTWGDLREEMGGAVIRRGGSAVYFLLGLVGGYLLATFVLIFVVGLAFGGFNDPSPSVVGEALLVAAGVGVLAGWRASRRPGRKAAVTIDRSLRNLRVESDQRHDEVPLDHIQCWLLRMIPNPRNAHSSGDTANAPLLSVLSADGRETPVHVFGARTEAPAIARRAAECFAKLTGRPLRFVDGDQGAGANAGSGVSGPLNDLT